jgi:hypothetical protein
MKIYDINGNILENPDLILGYLVEDKMFITHHDPVEAVEEKWHYEIVTEYPNGGKDVRKVIDIPGIAARDAWDEYENILRYIPYTDEELEEIRKSQSTPTLEDRLSALESAMLEMIIGGAVE